MLKRITLATLLSTVLTSWFCAPPASAQRYQDRQYRAYGWTGFYFGGSMGARYTDAKWATALIADNGNQAGPLIPASQPDSDQLDSRSFLGSIHAGYNWHAGSWVWGIEGDLGFARSSKTISGIPGTAPFTAPTDKLTAEAGNDGSLRLRAGVLLSPNTLWYATGGLAAQQAQFNARCPATMPGWCTVPEDETVSRVLLGYTIGGGVETAITRNWLARLEYRFSNYGKLDHAFFSNELADRFVGTGRFDSHKLGVGLSYKY
jgi:outer membrane immunogenic protein